jgi:precorrin-2 dehydrogenase/sirohydrochlorin ferrochelatase
LRSLTANLDLYGASVLVIGCGKVGLRKLSRLLGTGADITVVEPSPSAELLRLRDEGAVALLPDFSPGLLDGCRLAFSATGREPPPEVLEAANEGRLLLNVADGPWMGNFTLPAVAEDGEFSVAVSTGGIFPALSAAVAARLREEFRGWGAYLGLLGRARAAVLESGLPPSGREAVLRRLAGDTELPGLVKGGLEAEALALLGRLMAPVPPPPGSAVPAPPGGRPDPGEGGR